MKKHSLAEFIKSKSFYALLCVGALAILAIAMVGLNQPSDKSEDGNKLADLNEPNISDVAEGGNLDSLESNTDYNNTASGAAANNEEGNSQTEVAQQTNPNSQSAMNEPVTDGSLLESDAEDDPESVAANPADIQKGTTADSSNSKTADAAVKESADTTKEASNDAVESKEVLSPDTLYFDVEDGLLWPVKGNVLKDYSPDRVVYFETLAQFKCNPAVMIQAQIGTEVQNAANGIVTNITKEEETGVTVTVNIGSGYNLVYGQLNDDINLKVGDEVLEGQVIGTIAKPTMYYSVEGSNLYFQVVKDEETVNPMLLLR